MPNLATPARFEACEARRLFSSASLAVASVSHDTLTVHGVANDANVITVAQDPTAHTLTVTVVSTPASAPAPANDSSDDDASSGDSSAAPTPVTFSQTFDATGVTLVKVRGGKLADAISLVGVDPASAFSLDARVEGGDGNDTILTGSGNDRVDAGKGNDVVDSGVGNDLVWGGKGNDQLGGGDGNDTLFGGSGDDTLAGGAGDDVVFSLVGHDSVTGGTGSDTFVTRKLKRVRALLHDFGKHDHEKSTTKTGSDTADAPATA